MSLLAGVVKLNIAVFEILSHVKLEFSWLFWTWRKRDRANNRVKDPAGADAN